MINTWDKVTKDYASIFEKLRNRENIVRLKDSKETKIKL